MRGRGRAQPAPGHVRIHRHGTTCHHEPCHADRTPSFDPPKDRIESAPAGRVDAIGPVEAGPDQVEDGRATARVKRASGYEFLAKGEKRGTIVPLPSRWRHAVFAFLTVSLLACVVTLWAPYPVGARMTSDEVARAPWSDGCVGVRTCICPRETVCADDALSMALLSIARASAWFDYPLYMVRVPRSCEFLHPSISPFRSP